MLSNHLFWLIISLFSLSGFCIKSDISHVVKKVSSDFSRRVCLALAKYEKNVMR